MSVRNPKSKKYAFCCYYVTLGDVTESAVRAGFSREEALTEGIKMLESEECRKIISHLKNTLSESGNVSAGLKRLAFGNCSDAVYLVFADELPPPNVIEHLDLFNVSEIKRVKGGGVEVKLFDRLKALEKLFELENSFSDRDKASDLIKALSDSAEDGEVVDD
ncbi:MAG: terminase small subunit [Ruminococcus sp.]|nr:terminase small subunit [Ruminococcus sp.]